MTNRRTFFVGVLAALATAHISAAEPDLLSARTATMVLGYVPEIPSTLPTKWEPWEKSTDKLINQIAGNTSRIGHAKDIWYESARSGLDVDMVFVLVEMLSRFDAHRVSGSGNIGLLQLSPRTHDKFGNVENSLYQPKYNLRLGCSLIRAYLDHFHGDLELALRAFFQDASPQENPLAIVREFKRLYATRHEQVDAGKPPG